MRCHLLRSITNEKDHHHIGIIIYLRHARWNDSPLVNINRYVPIANTSSINIIIGHTNIVDASIELEIVLQMSNQFSHALWIGAYKSSW